MMKKILLLLAAVLLSGFIFLETYRPPLPENYGGVQAKLFLGDSSFQPLVVGFGGGSGGNDWARDYMKEKRDELLRRGYAVLAIGYFNAGNDTPKSLDRISLDAIAGTILNIASSIEVIDAERIALIGGSKGGELILNLASRYSEFGAVVPLSASHVSFPAVTLTSGTSSWSFQEQEVTYVPAPYRVILPALKGDLFAAFNMMLEDDEAAEEAEIAVEKINGPIFLMSSPDDEFWPASKMSDQVINRLQKNHFSHKFEHIKVEGGHTAPLDHFDKVYEFLDSVFKSDEDT